MGCQRVSGHAGIKRWLMNESDGEGERPAPLVAIINSSEGNASLLRQILEDAGLRTAVAYVPDLRRGQPDPTELLTEHDPRVIVYDVAVPYEESWDFLQSLRRLDAARGRRF